MASVFKRGDGGMPWLWALLALALVPCSSCKSEAPTGQTAKSEAPSGHTAQAPAAALPNPLPQAIAYWADLSEARREALFDAALRLMQVRSSERGNIRIPSRLAAAIYWLSRDPSKRMAAAVWYQSREARSVADRADRLESQVGELSRHPDAGPSDIPRASSGNTLAEWRRLFQRDLGPKASLLNPY